MKIFGRSANQGEIESYVEGAMPKLVGLAYAMTGSRADAEDLVQDTLATVVSKWSRISQVEHIDPYVRRTMVNTLISKKRRKWTSEVVSHEIVTAHGSPPVGAALGQQVADREAVLGLLRALPDRQRAVVALRYYEDLPDAEIALALGCSEQAVRSAAFNAMKTLRRRMPARTSQGVD